MKITITPIQMSRAAASAYCGVSAVKFDEAYRPHLTERKEGTSVYFLRTEIDKLIEQKFIESAQWASEKKRKSNPVPTQHRTIQKPKKSAFEQAIAKH